MLVRGAHDAAVADATAADLWSASGGRWLTDAGVDVPGALVRRVLGLVEHLDGHGAGLSEAFDGRPLGVLAERAALMGLPPSREVSAGGASRFIETEDGWVALSLARDEDVGLLPAWLETDAVPADGAWEVIQQLASTRSSAALVERATLLGLPCATVGEVDDQRPALATRLGDAPARPLDGALVLNLASLWAGPLCGDVLARLGCRLIKVESTSRPDGGRLAREFFNTLHGRSESIAIDLATASGRGTLRELLHRADIVIEGSRPRALEQMGIRADELVRDGPQVWISITSHGRDGNRVGFGDDAAAAGGLVGWVDGSPRFIADAVADPLTGLTAASAAVELLERGGRWVADVALARSAAAAAGDWIRTDQPVRERPRPRADRGATMPLGRDTAVLLRELLEDGAVRQP